MKTSIWDLTTGTAAHQASKRLTAEQLPISRPSYWTLRVTLIEWVSAVEPVPDVPVSARV